MERTHAELDAELVTRRVSRECDTGQSHRTGRGLDCENTMCQCWCHE
jgi:hypothetical protein